MLGNPASLGIGELLTISAIGLVIVFIALGLLILAIKVMSLVFAKTGAGTKKAVPKAAPAKAAVPAPARAAAPAAPAVTEEDYAAIVAAVSEETGLPLACFKITSITSAV